MNWTDIQVNPSKNGRYLLIDRYGNVGIEHWFDGEWITVDSEDMGDTTHWMPLPAPPEGIPDRRYF